MAKEHEEYQDVVKVLWSVLGSQFTRSLAAGEQLLKPMLALLCFLENVLSRGAIAGFASYRVRLHRLYSAVYDNKLQFEDLILEVGLISRKIILGVTPSFENFCQLASLVKYLYIKVCDSYGSIARENEKPVPEWLAMARNSLAFSVDTLLTGAGVEGRGLELKDVSPESLLFLTPGLVAPGSVKLGLLKPDISKKPVIGSLIIRTIEIGVKKAMPEDSKKLAEQLRMYRWKKIDDIEKKRMLGKFRDRASMGKIESNLNTLLNNMVSVEMEMKLDLEKLVGRLAGSIVTELYLLGLVLLDLGTAASSPERLEFADGLLLDLFWYLDRLELGKLDFGDRLLDLNIMVRWLCETMASIPPSVNSRDKYAGPGISSIGKKDPNQNRPLIQLYSTFVRTYGPAGAFVFTPWLDSAIVHIVARDVLSPTLALENYGEPKKRNVGSGSNLSLEFEDLVETFVSTKGEVVIARKLTRIVTYILMREGFQWSHVSGYLHAFPGPVAGSRHAPVVLRLMYLIAASKVMVSKLAIDKAMSKEQVELLEVRFKTLLEDINSLDMSIWASNAAAPLMNPMAGLERIVFDLFSLLYDVLDANPTLGKSATKYMTKMFEAYYDFVREYLYDNEHASEALAILLSNAETRGYGQIIPSVKEPVLWSSLLREREYIAGIAGTIPDTPNLLGFSTDLKKPDPFSRENIFLHTVVALNDRLGFWVLTHEFPNLRLLTESAVHLLSLLRTNPFVQQNEVFSHRFRALLEDNVPSSSNLEWLLRFISEIIRIAEIVGECPVTVHPTISVPHSGNTYDIVTVCESVSRFYEFFVRHYLSRSTHGPGPNLSGGKLADDPGSYGILYRIMRKYWQLPRMSVPEELTMGRPGVEDPIFARVGLGAPGIRGEILPGNIQGSLVEILRRIVGTEPDSSVVDSLASSIYGELVTVTGQLREQMTRTRDEALGRALRTVITTTNRLCDSPLAGLNELDNVVLTIIGASSRLVMLESPLSRNFLNSSLALLSLYTDFFRSYHRETESSWASDVFYTLYSNAVGARMVTRVSHMKFLSTLPPHFTYLRIEPLGPVEQWQSPREKIEGGSNRRNKNILSVPLATGDRIEYDRIRIGLLELIYYSIYRGQTMADDPIGHDALAVSTIFLVIAIESELLNFKIEKETQTKQKEKIKERFDEIKTRFRALLSLLEQLSRPGILYEEIVIGENLVSPPNLNTLVLSLLFLAREMREGLALDSERSLLGKYESNLKLLYGEFAKKYLGIDVPSMPSDDRGGMISGSSLVPVYSIPVIANSVSLSGEDEMLKFILRIRSSEAEDVLDRQLASSLVNLVFWMRKNIFGVPGGGLYLEFHSILRYMVPPNPGDFDWLSTLISRLVCIGCNLERATAGALLPIKFSKNIALGGLCPVQHFNLESEVLQVEDYELELGPEENRGRDSIDMCGLLKAVIGCYRVFASKYMAGGPGWLVVSSVRGVGWPSMTLADSIVKRDSQFSAIPPLVRSSAPWDMLLNKTWNEMRRLVIGIFLRGEEVGARCLYNEDIDAIAGTILKIAKNAEQLSHSPILRGTLPIVSGALLSLINEITSGSGLRSIIGVLSENIIPAVEFFYETVCLYRYLLDLFLWSAPHKAFVPSNSVGTPIVLVEKEFDDLIEIGTAAKRNLANSMLFHASRRFLSSGSGVNVSNSSDTEFKGHIINLIREVSGILADQQKKILSGEKTPRHTEGVAGRVKELSAVGVVGRVKELNNYISLLNTSIQSSAPCLDSLVFWLVEFSRNLLSNDPYLAKDEVLRELAGVLRSYTNFLGEELSPENYPWLEAINSLLSELPPEDGEENSLDERGRKRRREEKILGKQGGFFSVDNITSSILGILRGGKSSGSVGFDAKSSAASYEAGNGVFDIKKVTEFAASFRCLVLTMRRDPVNFRSFANFRVFCQWQIAGIPNSKNFDWLLNSVQDVILLRRPMNNLNSLGASAGPEGNIYVSVLLNICCKYMDLARGHRPSWLFSLFLRADPTKLLHSIETVLDREKFAVWFLHPDGFESLNEDDNNNNNNNNNNSNSNSNRGGSVILNLDGPREEDSVNKESEEEKKKREEEEEKRKEEEKKMREETNRKKMIERERIREEDKKESSRRRARLMEEQRERKKIEEEKRKKKEEEDRKEEEERKKIEEEDRKRADEKKKAKEEAVKQKKVEKRKAREGERRERNMKKKEEKERKEAEEKKKKEEDVGERRELVKGKEVQFVGVKTVKMSGRPKVAGIGKKAETVTGGEKVGVKKRKHRKKNRKKKKGPSEEVEFGNISKKIQKEEEEKKKMEGEEEKKSEEEKTAKGPGGNLLDEETTSICYSPSLSSSASYFTSSLSSSASCSSFSFSSSFSRSDYSHSSSVSRSSCWSISRSPSPIFSPPLADVSSSSGVSSSSASSSSSSSSSSSVERIGFSPLASPPVPLFPLQTVTLPEGAGHGPAETLEPSTDNLLVPASSQNDVLSSSSERLASNGGQRSSGAREEYDSEGSELPPSDLRTVTLSFNARIDDNDNFIFLENADPNLEMNRPEMNQGGYQGNRWGRGGYQGNRRGRGGYQGNRRGRGGWLFPGPTSSNFPR
jgi:hypothetical protein